MFAHPSPGRTGTRRAVAAPVAHGVRAAAVGAVVVVALLAGCSGSDAKSGGQAGSPKSEISPAFVPSGRASIGTTDTGQVSTTVGQGLPADPLSYARAFFAAWRDGIQSEAARYATSTAVTDLFAKTYDKADDWQGPNCSAKVVDKISTSTCTWTAKGGSTLTVRLRNPDLGNQGAVESVSFKNA